jgi:predicted MFS family arabinose efflux permease
VVKEEGDRLRRDRDTWFGYALVGLFAYLLYGLGAATPYLKSEFGLSDAVAGLHASAFALGAAGSGAVGERVVRIYGHERCLWLAAVTAALAGVGLAIFRHPAGTLAAAFVLGLSASLLLAIVNATLTEGHPRWSMVVLTEAQVFASVCSLATALIIGTAASGPLGWRAAMVLPILCVGGLFAIRRTWSWRSEGVQARPLGGHGLDSPTVVDPRRSTVSLPGRFWARWLVCVLVIGVEFSVVFWGPQILREHADLGAGVASASMGFFIGGMLMGRILGARLAARASFSKQLMPLGLVLAGSGAILAWFSPAAVVLQLALGVIGLGVANLYPQAVDAAIKSSGGNDLLAAARCSLAFGVALLLAPLLLGAVGDRFGVVNGLWLVAAMSATALLLNVASNRMSAKKAPGSEYGRTTSTIRH